MGQQPQGRRRRRGDKLRKTLRQGDLHHVAVPVPPPTAVQLEPHGDALADFELPAGQSFTAEIIDPWAMTITKADGTYSGKFQLKMPGKEMLAVRFRKSA